MSTDNCVIVKVEAQKEDIVSEFNRYMQASVHAPSFVEHSTGYFRISYDGISASSAGVVEFGHFLQSAGYAISGIHSVNAKEGEAGTEMCFEKDGMRTCAVISTLSVY